MQLAFSSHGLVSVEHSSISIVNNNNNNININNLGRSKQDLAYCCRGTFGQAQKDELKGHLESIGVNLDEAQIQKTALLGTARILRRVLDS